MDESYAHPSNTQGLGCFRPSTYPFLDHSFIGKTGGEIFHEIMLRQGVKHICMSTYLHPLVKQAAAPHGQRPFVWLGPFLVGTLIANSRQI